MVTRSRHDHDGYVVLNPELMEQLRLERGLSRRRFAELAETSPTTAYRFFNRQRVQTRTARKLFDRLNIGDMRPYLLGASGEENELHDLDSQVLAEWRIDNAMALPVMLSNGLEFRVFQLSHTVLPATFGRGKCYDLRRLNTRDNDQISHSVDLYSWAQVLVYAATAVRPSSPADPAQLDAIDLPDAVKQVARQCMSLSYKFQTSNSNSRSRAKSTRLSICPRLFLSPDSTIRYGSLLSISSASGSLIRNPAFGRACSPTQRRASLGTWST